VSALRQWGASYGRARRVTSTERRQKLEDGDAPRGDFLTQFLLAGLVAMQILTVVAPILLGILLHRAAVRLQLLVQAAAVDEDGLAGLGVPSSLPEDLLQLLEGVAAFPLPHAVLLHAAVAPAQGLQQGGGEKDHPAASIGRREGRTAACRQLRGCEAEGLGGFFFIKLLLISICPALTS